MNSPNPRAEDALLELSETMERQQRGFFGADGETIRRYADELEIALKAVFARSDAPNLSAKGLARLQIALERHARLLAAANARVERGLAALGLDTLPIARQRSRFGSQTTTQRAPRLTA